MRLCPGWWTKALSARRSEALRGLTAAWQVAAAGHGRGLVGWLVERTGGCNGCWQDRQGRFQQRGDLFLGNRRGRDHWQRRQLDGRRFRGRDWGRLHDRL